MLWLLILGVLLWSAVHLFPSIFPAKRTQWMETMGNAYQGLFALAAALTLVLIVVGWRNTVPAMIYSPPAWGRHLAMLLMLVAIILFGASHAKSRIKRVIRHPMLTGVMLWGIAHLLANGEIRSTVLFGGLTVWALISIYFINRRDGAWEKPEMAVTWIDELKLLGIAVVVYGILLFLHPYFTGRVLIAH